MKTDNKNENNEYAISNAGYEEKDKYIFSSIFPNEEVMKEVEKILCEMSKDSNVAL